MMPFLFMFKNQKIIWSDSLYVHMHVFFVDVHVCVNLDLQGLLNKFPDFFHIGTFIDSTHMKL